MEAKGELIHQLSQAYMFPFRRFTDGSKADGTYDLIGDLWGGFHSDASRMEAKGMMKEPNMDITIRFHSDASQMEAKLASRARRLTKSFHSDASQMEAK